MVIGVTLDIPVHPWSSGLISPIFLLCFATSTVADLKPWAAGHRKPAWSFPFSEQLFPRRPRWKWDPDSDPCLKKRQFFLNSFVQMNPYGQTALCRVFPWSRECPGTAAWRVPRLQLCKGRVIPWARAPGAAVPTLLHRSPQGTASPAHPNPHSKHCQVFGRRVSMWFQGTHSKPGWHFLCWLRGKLRTAGTCWGHPASPGAGRTPRTGICHYLFISQHF